MPATRRHAMPFGAHVLDQGAGVRFRLYAPGARDVVLLYDAGGGERRVTLEPKGGGWFETIRPDARPGTRYSYALGDLRVPDPASRFQPDGVHGASLVVDPGSFAWPDDAWRGRPWSEHVFYELHVGAFTPPGTYAAAAAKLPHLASLGVTAVELMPLGEFPGSRNWGYDGVLPYAPSHNYGSPDELKAFIAAAHAAGLSVFLDVVYNHFGPEGNYLHAYAAEFYTERFATPWGAAIDVDSPDRDSVRAFFIENALYWLDEYRFDGLRLDAVHAIYDGPGRAFLRELASAVRSRIERAVNLVVENEDNESRLLERDFRAQWNDDAHHAAHVAITGQADGYYGDYAANSVGLLGKIVTQGFAYQGDPSPFRSGRRRGEPSRSLPLGAFVNFLQNHDQVGNRPFGERITSLAPGYKVRAVLAVLLLAPSPPLLFMGEEWGASTPFLFFCDFEPELAKLVTEGRRNEFKSFADFADPQARKRIPDPATPETFASSKLQWEEREHEPHRSWLEFYRRVLAVRRKHIAPRISSVRGEDASYELLGRSGLRARWRLDDGAVLRLEANLGPEPEPGFTPYPQGNLAFTTHDDFADALAPPWSVRWTFD